MCSQINLKEANNRCLVNVNNEIVGSSYQLVIPTTINSNTKSFPDPLNRGTDSLHP